MDCFRLGQRKATRRKFIGFHAVVVNGIYQLIVIADRQEVNAKALFPSDIGIGMRVLIQIPHDSKESRFIPMKAAPGMEADIWMPILFPRSDRK